MNNFTRRPLWGHVEDGRIVESQLTIDGTPKITRFRGGSTVGGQTPREPPSEPTERSFFCPAVIQSAISRSRRSEPTPDRKQAIVKDADDQGPPHLVHRHRLGHVRHAVRRLHCALRQRPVRILLRLRLLTVRGCQWLLLVVCRSRRQLLRIRLCALRHPPRPSPSSIPISLRHHNAIGHSPRSRTPYIPCASQVAPPVQPFRAWTSRPPPTRS